MNYRETEEREQNKPVRWIWLSQRRCRGFGSSIPGCSGCCVAEAGKPRGTEQAGVWVLLSPLMPYLGFSISNARLNSRLLSQIPAFLKDASKA